MTIEDIALQMTPGIGVKGAVHLLGVFGSARDIFAAAPDELAGEAGLREEIAREIVRRRGFAAAEKELEHCRRNGIAAIASTDPEYPPLLREIPDYPHVLYIKGDTAALSARCLSMVGTRNATPYGQTMCNRLVEGLAAQVPGLCIVSGLAFGIDVAAHRAALAAGVPTVAVLANPPAGSDAGAAYGRSPRHPRSRRRTGHGTSFADPAERHGLYRPQPHHRRA